VKSRWIITAVSAALFFGGNLFTSLRDPWFQSLRRPEWLTIEFLIPFIWLFIWVCGTTSAILVWEKLRPSRPWLRMFTYAAIALLTSIYSPIVVELRSLAGGMFVGGLATLLVYILAVTNWRFSRKASLLLLPYMLWGPFGTYLTWLLIQLN
jgi:translocator protein